MELTALALVGGLTLALIIGVVVAVRKDALPAWCRVIAALLLLAPMGFSVFGFAASFEPGDYHWAWRIGYAAGFLVCAGLGVFLCWPRSAGQPADR